MFIESYSFVETMDTFAQSVEVGSNSVIKDLYNIDSLETNGQPL